MVRNLYLCSLCMLCWLWSGCLKKGFDIPPDTAAYDPRLPVNAVIRDLASMPHGTVINSDMIITGIVTMNDKEGNYYKKMTIQDSTGGIEVLLDQNNLYGDYPVGRKIYVRCKGLYAGAYGQNPQLGYIPDAAGNLSDIPFTLIGNHIVKANYPDKLQPDTLTAGQITDPSLAKARLNTLIVLRDMEFAAAGMSFAEPAHIQSATNRTLQDCEGHEIVLRTSGYARFQPQVVPAGNGIITAVYTRYNSTPQLYVRSPEDIVFTQERCDGTVAAADPSPIADIRALVASPGDSVASLPGYKITGAVISDKSSGNIAAANIVLQDASGGIVVRFDGLPPFLLGDSLLIDITGGKLSWYNNLLQVSDIPVSKVSKLASGRLVLPRTATIEQIMTHYDSWESTLVKVIGATVVGGGTYSGNRTIADATGSMTLYTRSGASFAGEEVPAGPADFTGILGIYGSTRQLLLRSLSDVEE